MTRELNKEALAIAAESLESRIVSGVPITYCDVAEIAVTAYLNVLPPDPAVEKLAKWLD